MLYAVLATGRPGETGVRDRFFQAQKQAQSFRLGSRILRAPIQSLYETALSNSDWRLWRRRHRIDVDRPIAVCRPISRVALAHSLTGSAPLIKTMGSVFVAALAANADGTSYATITDTL